MKKQFLRDEYCNILDYHSDAEAELNYQTNGKEQDDNFNYKLTNKANVFSDCGAWHGFYLPAIKNNSFFGPLIIDQEIPVNAGKFFSNFTFSINGKLTPILSHETYSVPGKLVIKQKYNEFELSKELIMIDARRSLIQTHLTNTSKNVLKLHIAVNGIAYKNVKYSSRNDAHDWKPFLKNITNTTDSISFNYNSLVNASVHETFKMVFDQKLHDFKMTENKNEVTYNFHLGEITIPTDHTSIIHEVQSFDFEENGTIIDYKDVSKYFIDNGTRWDKYITTLSKSIGKEYFSLAIKCMQTLIANWRSPAGAMIHNFIIPSITYTDFIGAWSWDTWKLSVGVSLFDQELAKDCIRALFDYQIQSDDDLRPQDAGMTPDCLFFNKNAERHGAGNNWNERNTKPSIAAWSVLFIYEHDLDLVFLKEIYSKIKAYNAWWNSNRSFEQNNILQFGATVDVQNKWDDKKTIIEAAAWESGMDNAPRFDWTSTDALKVFNDKQELIGYVIDQASVDLNAFNYLELTSLAKIATILGYEDEAAQFTASAQVIKHWINTHCYDGKAHCYFDVKIKDNKLVNAQGKADECMVCLFASAADEDKAQAVIKQLSADNYLTYVCFPSVAKDSPKFDPTNYWRGPVWLDQWYFGLRGLYNYGHKAMAKELLVNSIPRMKNLLNTQAIMENYNPLDGTGLATTNFSWSASMLLVALKEIFEGR